MTPIGYSANVIPYLPAPYNSDLAFQGNYAYQGTNNGFVVIDIENPANPKQVHLNTSCTTSQGDVVVYKNILVRSWDSPTSAAGAATQSCGGELVGLGFEGIHIFDITDPANPVFVRGLRFSTAGRPAPGLRLAHRDGRAGRGARQPLHLQRRLERHLHVDGRHQDQDLGPDPGHVRQAGAGRPPVPRQHGVPQRREQPRVLRRRQRHHDVQVRRHDRPDAAGRHREPDQMWSKQISSVSIGHSAAFSYDGKTVVFGHEPGGGVAAQCQTTSSALNRRCSS